MVDHHKEAQSVIGGALAASWQSLSGSVVRIGASITVLIVGFGINYAWQGSEAVSGLFEALSYAVVPVILFGVVFLWHLWLAPYRMMDRDRKAFEASIQRQVTAISGSVDHVRQSAGEMADSVAAFRLEAEKKIADHVTATESGWNDLADRIREIPGGEAEAAINSINRIRKQTEDGIRENLAFSEGCAAACGEAVSDVAMATRRSLDEIIAEREQLEATIAKLNPPSGS